MAFFLHRGNLFNTYSMLGQIRKSLSGKTLDGSYFLDVQALENSMGKVGILHMGRKVVYTFGRPEY